MPFREMIERGMGGLPPSVYAGIVAALAFSDDPAFQELRPGQEIEVDGFMDLTLTGTVIGDVADMRRAIAETCGSPCDLGHPLQARRWRESQEKQGRPFRPYRCKVCEQLPSFERVKGNEFQEILGGNQRISYHW